MERIDATVVPAAGMSQLDRLTSAFTAPSRTFEDIRGGNRSWYVPFIVLALVSYILFGAVAQHVSLQQTIQNQIRLSPRAQEQMARASPEQIEKMQSFWGAFTKGMFIGSPLVGLLSAVVIGAVFLATVNFVFEGGAQFGQILAVIYYAWLPGALQVVMGIVVMFLQPPEAFNIKNFAPTNPAALFLDPTYSSPALYTFLTQLDLITIWILVLMSIGVATVANVKCSAGFVTVFGWWILVVICKVGFAAAFN